MSKIPSAYKDNVYKEEVVLPLAVCHWLHYAGSHILYVCILQNALLDQNAEFPLC